MSSFAEEAARFADALEGWSGHAAGGAAAECVACPVCRALRGVRGARPEVFGHLADASSSLAAALRAAVDGAGPAAGSPEPVRVQRIVVD